MKLRDVRLIRYRQFIDEYLALDPHVTVIVGRNDSGKTNFLDHFFDQCVYEGVIGGGDRPLVPGYQNNLMSFSMTWDLTPEDYDRLPLPPELGPRGHHVLEISFSDLDRPGEYYAYRLDGRPVQAHEGSTAEGMPIRKAAFASRYILPAPRYITVGTPILANFEMRPYSLPPGAVETTARRLRGVEWLLLHAAGISAHTRPVRGRGIDEPWDDHALVLTPPRLTLGDIEERLRIVSQRVTAKLREWWHDPEGLTFEVKLAGDAGGKDAQRRLNSYLVIANILDESGIPYHGAGLMWFTTFLIELLFVEDQRQPVLLLFDEPATPLHPSAQRAVAKLLNSLSSRHQVIYSTHSPFMIDWNFPQRLRLFHRDYESKRTHIANKPYSPLGPLQRIWDPLRSAIGVTLGDVAIIGEENILLEGITDQVILANASIALEAAGRPHLDLTKISIIPYGEEPVLRQLVGAARSRQAKIVVLADTDQQGAKIAAYCRREKISYLTVHQFAEAVAGDCSVEDLIGVDAYCSCVNELYARFPWFIPLDPNDVRAEKGNRSLGAYLPTLFDERFGQAFDKTAVAIRLAEELPHLDPAILGRCQALIEECVRSVA
jgi:AAA ATPase-like protein